MRCGTHLGRVAAFVAAGIVALGAHAAPSEDETRKAWQDAGQAAIKGPADVPLAGEAVLHLPANEAYVPRAQALRLLNVMGNPGDDPNLQGLILPQDEKASWFMVVDWKAEGYVKDDDAKNWNADDLLKSYREGTEESNKERARMGVPQLDIVGWAEPPKYDAATQRLVWALSSRETGAPADAEQGVNYNTYALGREGYFELNLVGSLKELPDLKPVAARQLAALQFNDGKRYADFDAKTDHVAEYGLAALVVGVAAKKLGLLALAGVFIAKFAKVILIALAAFGGGFLKFFRRKKESPAVAGAYAAAPAMAPGPASAPARAPVPDLPPLELEAPASSFKATPAPAPTPAAPAPAPATPAPVPPAAPAHDDEPTVDPFAPTLPMPLDGPDAPPQR